MDHDSKQPEIQPTVLIDTFEYRHVDLELLDTQRIRDMLTDQPREAELVPYRPNLPSLILESDFSYSQTSLGEHSITGGLDFDPLVVEHNEHEIASWIDQVFTHLKEAVENEAIVDPTYTVQLKHDPNTIYMLVNLDTYAAITASADPNRCYISVQTYPFEFITKMAGIDSPYDEDDDLAEADPYEALANTAKLWALTHDAVIDLFGKPGRRQPKRLQLGIKILSNNELVGDGTHDSMTENNNRGLLAITEHRTGNMPAIESLDGETVTFSSIGGSHQAVARLREIKELQTPANRELARSMGINSSNSGFLLHGPWGTGKSLLMQAFGNELGVEVITIDSEEIVDKWVGNSGKNISKLFDKIKAKKTPVLVVMDEFDTLGVAPKYASSGERVDVTNILKREISELSLPQYSHIFLAAATNNIDRIDPALIRSGRLEKIYVGLPNQSERADIWACLLNERFKDQLLEMENDSEDNSALFHSGIQYAEDVDPMALSLLTDEMSGADIHAIIEKTWNSKFLSVVEDPSTNRAVTLAELKRSIAEFRKTL